MYVLLIFTVFFAFLLRHVGRPYKPPIVGIYQQENTFYLLKYFVFSLFLSTRQFVNKLKRKKNATEVGPDGLHATEEDRSMDAPQALHNHPQAIDAVYFNGSSSVGAAIVCGVARRPEGICNAFLYLRVKGGELLLSPKLPDTTLKQTSDEEGQYHVEGINLYPIEPMKTWKIEYSGQMKLSSDPLKSVKVELDATWSAVYNHFNYDSDMSPCSMARDVARETWSKDYFKSLKELHQTHYEQHGNIKGTVKIDDVVHQIFVNSVRDHSFGKLRDWKNFHRYGLHFIALENGDRITVGTICLPICFSSLSIGFLCRRADNKLYPVDVCNLELFRHGENLTPPLDYAFQFKAGGELYTVQVDIQDSPTFYIGPEHECRVVERLANFEVNGVKGWGAAEWQYRNVIPAMI